MREPEAVSFCADLCGENALASVVCGGAVSTILTAPTGEGGGGRAAGRGVKL